MLDPVADVFFQCGNAFVGAAAGELVGEVAEPAFHLVDPGGSGRGEVHVETRAPCKPLVDDGRLWVARLSQIRCTSSSAGTVLSMLVRNFLNSVARWRRCSSVMTVPSAMLNAANRLVVPWRA